MAPGFGVTSAPAVDDGSGHPPVWLVRNKIDLSVSDKPGSKTDPDSRAEIGSEAERCASGGIGNRIQPNSDVVGRNESDSSAYAERSQAHTRNVQQFIPYNASPDTVNESSTKRNESQFISCERTFNISALHGGGLEGVLTGLAAQASGWLGGEAALVTRVRHRQALEAAKSALERAAANELDGRDDLVAEDLRAAAHALGRLTGRVDVEDVLDAIFRDFCIGK